MLVALGAVGVPGFRNVHHPDFCKYTVGPKLLGLLWFLPNMSEHTLYYGGIGQRRVGGGDIKGEAKLKLNVEETGTKWITEFKEVENTGAKQKGCEWRNVSTV